METSQLICPQCWIPHSGKLSHLYPFIEYINYKFPLYFCSCKCLFAWEKILPMCEYCRDLLHAQNSALNYITFMEYRDKYFCINCWSFIDHILPINKSQGKLIRFPHIIQPISLINNN